MGPVMLARPALIIAAATLLGLLVAGCGTSAPAPITSPSSRLELEQAEFFPYFRVYWDGLHFQGIELTAADGTQNYNSSIGETLQYGDCDTNKGVLHTGGCTLPLEIVTVIWHHHSNANLGSQYNTIIRNVPATVFNGGKSIEVYTGKDAIDVYADSPARARAAVLSLRTLNAPGRAGGPLPAPDFCPGFVGVPVHFKVARDADGNLDCVDALTVGYS